ncbi:hypothetical protein KIN20_031682 [Parelaphostrongylus tenuis]|uniref:Uncharacterized protein n=1 Tax=Parelaphostrongylus tenuis TaxID=148309 RepID=A0AAD5R5H9_PARTN|nr:hypothetical protein KIN20_031682 [Parelaphostrongylus tenuis]
MEGLASPGRWIELLKRKREMVNHVEFVFHYRITEFMRLIVDDVDLSEAALIADIAAWMMKKISDCCSCTSALFSMNEEDEVGVDTITAEFLVELLGTCARREIERVDFEVDSEPRSVCWKSYSFTEEKDRSNSVDVKQQLEAINGELDFDDAFIDFLKKLELRQEMIKESALSLLSPRSTILSHQQSRTEKSVQTSPIALPAEVFVPELPSPDLSELRDHKVDIVSVDNLVDSLFDFDQKWERNNVLRRLTTPRFLSPRKIDRESKNVFKCLGKSMKKISSYNSLDMECPSRIEDMIALQNTAVVAHRMQKKWERMQNEDRLSMTAALSTGVGGSEESFQSDTRAERQYKRKENDEWIIGLLRMMEQKPGRSRKLLKGLMNISKEHKGSKPSKLRSCDICRRIDVPRSKSFESDKSGEETAVKPELSTSESSQHSVDLYTYMKRKLKEHEKAKKHSKLCDFKVEAKKLEKEKNQEDIRAYLVGRKIIEGSCKKCGSQADIRDFLVGKKVKQLPKVEGSVSRAQACADSEQHIKCAKSKPSAKQRNNGKYLKLANTPTLAVLGESPVNYIGRLSDSSGVYSKSFKMINLSRKDLQIDVVPINWPDHVRLLHQTSTTLGPGETKKVEVKITRSSAAFHHPECHLLSIVHRDTPISVILSFTIYALAHEGPLLSHIGAGKEVQESNAFSEVPGIGNSNGEKEANTSEDYDNADPTDTVQTVVDMLKDQVDSACTAVLPQNKVEEDAHRTAVEIDLTVEANIPMRNPEDEELFDSVRTAIEDHCDQYPIDAAKDVVLTIDRGSPFDDSSSLSDFEVVDIEGL